MELKGATVAPFILRGVTLRGVDSVFLDMKTRTEVYKEYSPILMKSQKLDIVTHGKEQIIGLDDVSEAAKKMMSGNVKGRYVVEL